MGRLLHAGISEAVLISYADSCSLPVEFFKPTDIALDCTWDRPYDFDSNHHYRAGASKKRFIDFLISRGLRKLVTFGSCLEVSSDYNNYIKATDFFPYSCCSYGAAKSDVLKHLIRCFFEDELSFVWVRPSYIYSLRSANMRGISKLAFERVNSGLGLKIGSVDAVRDFVEVEWLVGEIEKIVKQLKLAVNRQALLANLFSGSPQTLPEFLNNFLRCVCSPDIEIDIEVDQRLRRSYEPDRIIGHYGVADIAQAFSVNM